MTYSEIEKNMCINVLWEAVGMKNWITERSRIETKFGGHFLLGFVVEVKKLTKRRV